MFLFKAEAVGLEPTTGISPAPVFETGSSSGRMTSIHVQAAETGIEPVSRRLTVACPYQHGLLRNSLQSAWSDLNRITVGLPPSAFILALARWPQLLARSTRISRLSHTLIMHPAGVEPALPPWRDSTLPLRHGCVKSWPICQRSNTIAHRATDFRSRTIQDRKQKSTGWESNPRCRVTSAESSPLDDQCVNG